MTKKTLSTKLARLGLGVMLATAALGGGSRAPPPRSTARRAPTHFPIVKPPLEPWSFAGLFGTFDTAQLQRGYQVYKEVCASCHSMHLALLPQSRAGRRPAFHRGAGAHRRGGQLPGAGRPRRCRRHVRASRPAVRPLPVAVPEPAGRRRRQQRQGAAGPVADGQGARRRARLPVVHPRHLHAVSGRRPGLYPRPARPATRSRRPASQIPPGLHYNTGFNAGYAIAMPTPLSDGQVTYTDGAPQTVDQYSRDVAAFLMWAAEPHLDARKRAGFQVIIFLIVFAGLLYYTKKKIWSKVAPSQAPSDRSIATPRPSKGAALSFARGPHRAGAGSPTPSPPLPAPIHPFQPSSPTKNPHF